jgi:hypothetical protein
LAIVILALTADCFSSSVANDTELKIELRYNAKGGIGYEVGYTAYRYSKDAAGNRLNFKFSYH